MGANTAIRENEKGVLEKKSKGKPPGGGGRPREYRGLIKKEAVWERQKKAKRKPANSLQEKGIKAVIKRQGGENQQQRVKGEENNTKGEGKRVWTIM